MVQPTARTHRAARRTLASSFIAALIVVLTATSASATGPGHYEKFVAHNGHFLTLSQYNLATEPETDDAVFYLSTSGAGANRLPFQLGLYNQWYRNIAISTNGNIQLGVTSPNGNEAYANDCLRSPTIPGPAIFPFWDDLYYPAPGDTTLGFPQGVFVKTFGRAPNRVFIVSWQGVLFADETVAVKAQAIFRERSQNVTFVYGSDVSGSPTIGVQSGPRINRKTQYLCDSDETTQDVSDGLKLAFVHDD